MLSQFNVTEACITVPTLLSPAPPPYPIGMQELTAKALQIIRKLVEMENHVEDSKPSVLEWDTVGDDPEVPGAQRKPWLGVCVVFGWGWGDTHMLAPPPASRVVALVSATFAHRPFGRCS